MWSTGKTVYLKRQDFQRLLDTPLLLRDKILVRLPLKSGLRPYEVRHQLREEIDFKEEVLYVPPCKGSPRRPVPVDPVTLEMIKEYMGRDRRGVLIRPLPGYEHKAGLVLGKNGLRWNVKQIARAAGITEWRHYYPYLLRHHFAADWALKKGNLETLRRILGHTSLATTQFYLMRLIYVEDVKDEYSRIKGVNPKMEEAGLFIWRVTYHAPQPNGKGTVTLVDNIRADDIDGALKKALDLADKREWIVKAVEKANG